MRAITGRPAVYAAALWQLFGAALCIPYFVHQPEVVTSSGKGIVLPTALGWDLACAMLSIFALFAHSRNCSIAVVACGSVGIVATCFFGSYAVVQGAFTACCCSSSACFMSGTDRQAFADTCGSSYGQACMTDNVSLWLFWAGICLSQVAIVLLTAAAALHMRVCAIDHDNLMEALKSPGHGNMEHSGWGSPGGSADLTEETGPAPAYGVGAPDDDHFVSDRRYAGEEVIHGYSATASTHKSASGSRHNGRSGLWHDTATVCV